MSFFTDSIPEYLLQKDRSVDNEFEDNEILCIRCLTDHVDFKTKKLITAGFPAFPKTSTNRDKYCQDSDDVLIPIFLDWGVACFRVEHTKLSIPFGMRVRS